MPALRMSILNVDEAVVTPLKFRGWLRDEAISIQHTAKDAEDVIMIRIFMTERFRIAITQKALDKMFKAVVDKNPNIHKLELRTIESALSNVDVSKEADIAKVDLQDMVEGMQSRPKTPTTFH